MASMDEYIEQLLAEMPGNVTLRTVVQNILDEPIPEAVKKRLLKPLLPRPIPLPRKRKLEKQKAVLQEFDKLYSVTRSKLGVKNKRDLLSIDVIHNLTDLPQFVLLKKAGGMKDYTVMVPLGHRLETDALVFLNAMKANTIALIEKEVKEVGGVKFSLVLTAELAKLAPNAQQDDDEIVTTAYLWSHAMPVLTPREATQGLSEAIAEILKRLEKFMKDGSGWKLKRCELLDLKIAPYQPFRGRSYIKTPACIPPRSVINIKNEDNRCFEWAILSAIYPVGFKAHPNRPKKYQAHLGELNFTGISFPVKVTDIPKIEYQNPGLSVNVFGWKGGLYPLHVSKREGRAIDLLLINDRKEPGKTHYVWIKDLPRMLYKNSNHKERKHPCRRCLHIFSTEKLLEDHKNDCQGIDKKPQRTVMPEEGKNILKFANYRKQMRAPFIIYADFEALNIPVEGRTCDPGKSCTRQIAKQTPCSYCYVIVRCDGVAKAPVLYRGENAVEHFLESLQAELIEINEVFREPAYMVMTVNDRKSFANATDCHICGEELGHDKVRDHCHITGKYRGAAHKACNLQLRISSDGEYYCRKTEKMKKKRPTKVPVIFHNLRGYDGHLIMSALGKSEAAEDQKISCIPNNMEKYMTFSIGQLQFIDSLQFMNSSLDKLAANTSELWTATCGMCREPVGIRGAIARDGDDVISSGKCGKCKADVSKRTPWTTLVTRFPHMIAQTAAVNQAHLLLRKGVYPYEHVDSFERFDERQLPPKEAFYSQLTREHIDDADYQHGQKIWSAFRCQTLGEYHDIYLRTDVLLLADVFETFRNTSMQNYDLDPANYFSAPGMSWDALLKKTKVQLELLTDIDMHLFSEKGLRGGVCMASKRFAKANNPMCPDYDNTMPTNWIMYLDANNLYGWAMSQLLPVGGFQWTNPEVDEVLATSDDAAEGYILEVDMEYPEQLHDSHNDNPLAPEALVVPETWMSNYQRTLVNELGGKFTECMKLVPNLRKKERYIVHYRNLKLYHSLGMHVTRIHRVLKFRQEAWMAPYIQLNTYLRSKAKSEFEKDFFKLMNNSVFGKTMENLRKRIRVDLVRASEKDRMRRLVADPAYLSHKIFEGDLVAIHSTKSRLTLNRPIYVGQSVLDLSKHRMYDFWYNHIKARYGGKSQLCYTDTDSLLFQVETENVYEDMKNNASEYDFSDYPKDHPCYSTENKKVVGKFKDECYGRSIAEFVGLRPKMYSILEAGGNNIKKAKGVQRVVVNKDLKHELYKQCLDEHTGLKHTHVVMLSKGHQMGIYEQTKTSLSPLDTKKWITPDGITTRAYGHYRTNREDAAELQAYLNELLDET